MIPQTCRINRLNSMLTTHACLRPCTICQPRTHARLAHAVMAHLPSWLQVEADEEAEQELRALVQLLDNFMQRDVVDFSEGPADGAPAVPVGEVCVLCSSARGCIVVNGQHVAAWEPRARAELQLPTSACQPVVRLLQEMVQLGSDAAIYPRDHQSDLPARR